MSDMGICHSSEDAVVASSPAKPRAKTKKPKTVSDAKLTEYNRLLRRLSTSASAISALPKISAYITHTLKLTRERVLSYLEMSSEPEVRSFLDAYHHSLIPDDLRETFPLELYCAVAKLSPPRLLELLGAQIVRAGAHHSAIMLALRQSEVLDATITSALVVGRDGLGDRNTLHRASGILPTPKGAKTIINVDAHADASATALAAAVSAPPPELTIRNLVDRYNRVKGLNPGDVTATPALPATIEAESVPEFDGDASDDIGDDADVAIPVPVMSPARALAKTMFERGK
jgi:hypothetical protein